LAEVVKVSCVRHSYPDDTQVHFCGLDFVVNQGEKVVILGPNGCGKTTLLSHILGLLKPEEGEVRVFGVDPVREFHRIRNLVGTVLQNVDEQLLAPTVWDDVSFTPRNLGYPRQEVTDLTERALSDLDIQHLRDKVPHYLSGGERRKVAVAGALATRPKLLVLDEPFEGLDPVAKSELVNLLNRVNAEEGTSIIITTHDVNLVPLFADCVYMLLAGGEIKLKGRPEEVFGQHQRIREANLEQPLLFELFSNLVDAGLPVKLPGGLSEAVAELVRLYRDGGHGEGTRDA
jgi:cobalt/nickel transport system ATP-binding protein